MKKKLWCVTGVLLLVIAGIVIFAGVHNRKAFPQTMYVNVNVCKVRAGAGEEFDAVGLLAAEEQVTALEEVKGKNGQTWYRIDEEVLAENGEAVDECFIRSDLLRRE